MKSLFRLGTSCVLLFLCVMQGIGTGVAEPDVIPYESKPVIKVIDSLTIDLSKLDSTICIDDKVVLSFDNDSVFACEWIDVVTGDTISKAKSITVAPDSTTKYQVNLYYFTGELIPQGNFENATANNKITTGYTKGYKGWTWGWEGNYELWPEGRYCIGKSPRNFHPYFYDIHDHTSGKGNMMVVNGSTNGNAVVWKTTVKNIEKGRIYAFSTWGVEVGRNNPAQFHFTINNKTLGKDFQLKDYGETEAKWEQFYELWVADDDEAVISLVNLNTRPDGNDFAVDDISFASMQKKSGVITVKVLPAVKLGKLKDIEKCEGEKIVVNANATGTGITEYKWVKDGRLLTNRQSLLEFPNAVLGDAGNYSCSVTGECGTREVSFKIDVREKLRIAKLRDTVRPCERNPVIFSAGATGYLPTYRWTKPVKSQGWSGEKTATYSNPQIYWDRDTGTYTCRISSKCGDTTVYRMLEPGHRIKITSWPGDQTVCAGSSLRLRAETDIEPLNMVWSGPGMGLFYGKEFVLNNITERNVGVYTCTALDNCMEGESKSFILTLIPAMTTLVTSKDTAVCEGGKATFVAKADGLKTRYEWTGPNGFSAATDKIVIDPVTPDRIGEYQVVAVDSCGNRKPGKVNLSLLKEYDGLQITGNLEVCPGELITLQVTGGGRGLTYDWTQPQGTHTTGSILRAVAENGNYICKISGVCRPVEKMTTVTLKKTLQAEAGTNSFLVCPGENVRFLPVFTGTHVVCEWWKGDVRMSSETSLALNGVGVSDAGGYECRVHSDCGDAVLYYTLQLKEALRIVDHTAAKSVKWGEKTSLFANVSGSTERTYEWFLDGRRLTGETGNRINIQAPNRDAVLIYTFKVSGCNVEQVDIPVYVRNFETVTKDSTIRLCKGNDYSYRVPEKPEDWCKDGRVKMYWVYNGKDTVSRTNAISFAGFDNARVGQYVYHLESDCGNETVRLQVDSMPIPEIVAIRCVGGSEKNGTITACMGEEIQLTPEVKTYGVVAYEWSKNGVVIQGATGAVLTLKNVNLEAEGRYALRVISAECGEAVKEITLKVYKKLSVTFVPEIEKCPGDAALLQVNTDASVASEFVWSGPDKSGWIAENDGYSASYKHAAIRLEHDGVYQCKVTNVCGVEVAEIRLLIEKAIELPELARHDTVCPGGSIELKIPLEQTGAKCSWTLPDHSVVEQAVLSISHFSTQDTGVYHYTVKTKNNCFTQGGDVSLHMRPELQAPWVSPDTAVCEGNAVSFVAYAEGKEVEYEWWGPQGMKVGGQRLDIAAVTAKQSGVYEVVVTDVCNKTGKRGRVKLSLLKEFDGLVVSRDTGVCQGSDVQLKVVSPVAGLKYQWSLGEQVLGNEATLILNKVEGKNSGKYVCRISGTCQTIEKEVNLNVYQRLMAEKQEFLPVCAREDVVLSVSAAGEKVGYRWMKGVEEKGYRTSELTLYDVIPSDAGVYECRVSSLCGDTTLYYNFNLKEETRILRYSADRILCEGDSYKLMVMASGVNNQYTWACDGTVLPQHEDVIDCRAPNHADTLLYTCLVQGDCGVDSIAIVIKIGEYRKIRENLKDTLCEGSNYKYNVDVVPLGAFEGQGFHYRWTFKGEVFDMGQESVFPLTEVKPDQAGDYHCEITTLPDAPEFKSAEVTVSIVVTGLPRINRISPDIYAVEGSNASIGVDASGDQLTYSWTKDGVAVSHASPDWNFAPLDYDDRGMYEVVVANRCSRATKKVAVEVWKKTIIVYPQERTDSVCRNGSKDLDVIAWGEEGLLYKWELNGVPVDAPYTQPLAIREAQPEDAGLYVCIVTGRGGSDSCKIHLNVLGLPEPLIDGKFRLCRDAADMEQIYIGTCKNECRVNYDWKVSGGELVGDMNWMNTTVRWDGAVEGELTLKQTSLTTGCVDSMTEQIVYLPLPDVNVTVPAYVGNCRDTLVLDRAYPWGGAFTVNGTLTDVVRFTNKNIYYSVGYYYTDLESQCSAAAYDTIHIASAPVLQLAQDTVRTGWCVPVPLEVSKHSKGTIEWGGTQMPEVTDATHAVYKAKAYSEKIQDFWAVLTDVYQCEAADTTHVILIPSPVVSLSPDTLIGVCNLLVLRGKYDTRSPQKVEWMPVGKLNVMDGFTAEVLEKKAGVHQFELAVTDQYGCVGKDAAEVTMVEAPLLESKEVCVGAELVIDASVYPRYFWSDGYMGAHRVMNEVGTYDLEVTDQYGCVGEATYQIHALPVVRLKDTLIYEGQKIDFSLGDYIDYPPYEIEWQDGSSGLSYTAGTEGYYSVKVMDNIGCMASDTAYLTVKKWYIAAPDAFLPASRGENARFYLKEVDFGSRFEMYIYDRWGELLFKTNEIGYNGGWDGTFKGMNCQPGAYVWVAFVDGKEVARGTLMLVK